MSTRGHAVGATRRLRAGILGGVAGLTLAMLSGCGHGTAAASDSDAARDEDLAEFLRMLSEERGAANRLNRDDDDTQGREAGDREPGTLAITIERPVDFALGHDRPPADVEPLDRLRAEEVLLSFAMYAEAGRYEDQWSLLSDATRRAWLDRIRREARRVGMATVEAQLAGADARWLWSRGFAAGGAHVDLAVRWRTRVTGEQAMVQILRGQEVLDDIALVRERGAWRLDLSARIEQGASTRRATD